MCAQDEGPVVVELLRLGQALDLSEGTLSLRQRAEGSTDPASLGVEARVVLRGEAIVGVGEEAAEVVPDEVEVHLEVILLLREGDVLQLDEEGGDVVVIAAERLLVELPPRTVDVLEA